VTLTRLFLAWLPVAVWFLVVTLVAIPLLAAALSRPSGQQAVLVGWSVPHAKTVAKWRLAEAAILTLFASLWFDSLGSGGWWLLFLLVGVLIAGAEWVGTFSRADVPLRASLAGACGDVVRYLVAGAILAWRLG
jgi:hypothetical protein